MRKGKKDDTKIHLEADQKPVEPASDNSGVTGDEQGSEEQQEQVTAEEAKIAELTADLQRLQAEFQNYKRREDEAKATILDMAKRDTVLQLLPVLDNIDRALSHRPEELADNAWANGVEQVAKQTQDQLKKLGVERIESVGQSFNHDLHEAIGFEDGDGENEVVIEELQPGYKMGNVVIRHAMVRVGKA